jgi:RNA polymerase sigma-70 factor, ECF subfamily
MRLSASLDFAGATEDYAAQDRAEPESSVAQRMDAAAFQIFYAQTAPGLRGYLRRACGNEALADDILQEAFLRFLRAERPALADAPLRAYLYKIAMSLLVDHWRRVNRERRWSLRNFLGSEPATHPRSDRDAMRFFRRLKPQEQLLLWLAYVEGFDHGEIAASLRVKEKSVRVLLFRARNKLGRTLESAGLGRKEAG